MLSPLLPLSSRISALGLALTVLVSAEPLRAQVGASTLAALVGSADIVVQARTSGVPSGNAAVHRFRFQTEVDLQGNAPAQFELSEPAGRSCGRALAGLTPGSYLLFLSREGSALRLVVSGARSVVPAEPTIVAHVRALLASPTGRDRLVVLGGALTSASPRVRHDAATSLAYLPELPSASSGDRARVAAALVDALGREPSATALLIAAERLRLAEALDDLLDAYLEGRHPQLERLLLHAIPRLDGERAARRIAGALPTDAAGRRRAAILLRELPHGVARQPLVELLSGVPDAAAVRAGVALLAAGVDPAWVERHAAPSVSEAIRRAASQRPAFRAILRGQSR